MKTWLKPTSYFRYNLSKKINAKMYSALHAEHEFTIDEIDNLNCSRCKAAFDYGLMHIPFYQENCTTAGITDHGGAHRDYLLENLRRGI